jgi:hypothetical protein
MGSTISSRKFGHQGAGRLPCLVMLISGDLVARHASLGYMEGTWSSVPPHWCARQGLGRVSRLAGLFGGD